MRCSYAAMLLRWNVHPEKVAKPDEAAGVIDEKLFGKKKRVN